MTAVGSRLETTFSAVLVVVAVTMLSLHLHDRTQRKPAGKAPTIVEEWETLNATGIPFGGAPNAPLVITEFMDFTCPYCSQMAVVIDSLVSRFPKAFRVVFHHFPLRGHELAVPAAVAAECAREQGRFNEIVQSLFAHQDSIGSWDWSKFGNQAGVSDLDAYSACLHRPDGEFPRIVAGRAAGEKAGVNGTPTIWLNDAVVTPRTVADFIELARSRKIRLR